MGFLGGLFKGKSDKAEASILNIEYKELPGWINAKKEELESGLDESARPVISTVPEKVDAVRTALDSLEKANMHREVHPRIKSVVAGSRENYVKKAKRIFESIDTDRNAIDLTADLDKTLKGMASIDLRYGERAKFGFEKELSAVRKNLTELAVVFESLNCAIGERRERLGIIAEIEALLKKIDGERKAIEAMTKREGDEARLSKEDEAELASKDSAIASLKSSERAQRFEKVKKQLGILASKKQEIDNQVLNTLGPLKRAFKKYVKAVEEGKANGFNVSKYSEDPSGTYLKGDNTLPDLLAKLQKAIQSGIVSLDEGEDEKTLKKIRGITFSNLETLRQEHMEVCRQMRKLEVEAAELDIGKDLEKLESEKGSIIDKLGGEKENVVRMGGEIRSRRQTMGEQEKKLAELLSKFIKGRCEVIS